MKCQECGHGRIISIRVQLGDGSHIELSTCQYCESKVWTSSEGEVPLTRVLELASANRPR
jgi:DNA-directed RNA polymerase subunit RPC12/RpoP